MATTSKGAVMRIKDAIAGVLFILGLIGVMGIVGNESLDIALVALYSVPFLLMMWAGSVLASGR